MTRTLIIAVIVMLVEYSLCFQLARSMGTAVATIFSIAILTGVIVICTGMIIKKINEIKS